MLRFPHQFPIALENAAKSIELSLENWYPYFPQNMGAFFHQIPILWFSSISHSISSRHAGTKSKIYQKKKRAWMLFYQKRGIQIYIRQKYTTLHKTFLTFNNQLQKLQLLPKNFNEKRSNRGVWRGSDAGYSFKKDS